ncbi:MAG: DUF4269 domain-containing protein [Bdellovibrionaceae bacterium]|nr:DUF4269 domain-containing protein [Pseudobdellovibrionaceae bacterium]
MWRALLNSNLLSKWKVYEPMVAGPFLLGLEVDNSNLEILMTSADPEETLQAILKDPKFVNVRFQNTLTPEGPAGIAQFDFESVPFEVRIQTFASVRQSAYVQFLLKERALKDRY